MRFHDLFSLIAFTIESGVFPPRWALVLDHPAPSGGRTGTRRRGSGEELRKHYEVNNHKSTTGKKNTTTTRNKQQQTSLPLIIFFVFWMILCLKKPTNSQSTPQPPLHPKESPGPLRWVASSAWTLGCKSAAKNRTFADPWDFQKRSATARSVRFVKDRFYC